MYHVCHCHVIHHLHAFLNATIHAWATNYTATERRWYEQVLYNQNEIALPRKTIRATYFFLPPLSPSSLRSQEITFPNMTTPFPSMNATRERPSQFLNVSQTRGC